MDNTERKSKEEKRSKTERTRRTEQNQGHENQIKQACRQTGKERGTFLLREETSYQASKEASERK